MKALLTDWARGWLLTASALGVALTLSIPVDNGLLLGRLLGLLLGKG